MSTRKDISIDNEKDPNWQGEKTYQLTTRQDMLRNKRQDRTRQDEIDNTLALWEAAIPRARRPARPQAADEGSASPPSMPPPPSGQRHRPAGHYPQAHPSRHKQRIPQRSPRLSSRGAAHLPMGLLSGLRPLRAGSRDCAVRPSPLLLQLVKLQVEQSAVVLVDELLPRCDSNRSQ